MTQSFESFSDGYTLQLAQLITMVTSTQYGLNETYTAGSELQYLYSGKYTWCKPVLRV